MNSQSQKTRFSQRQSRPTWKKREADAFVPIIVEQLPIDPETIKHALPEFSPPLRVPYKAMRSTLSVEDPLSLFLALFGGEESLQLIVDATNAKADAFTPTTPSPRPRPWKPLTCSELVVWIGSLFYMGRHQEPNREYYWNPDKHTKLSNAISKTRWEQIFRFLAMYQEPIEEDNTKPWWYKIKPLVSIVRHSITAAVVPATWVAVDEMMIPFRGRTAHTLKIKNKPVKEGFKIWALAFSGYIYSFKFHSHDKGSEGISPQKLFDLVPPLLPVKLASTFQVPIALCTDLRSLDTTGQDYLVFLDNLFLNVDVAHCLLNIGFATMGTTRKNATGVPEYMNRLKNRDKEQKQLIWNSTIAQVVGRCLVFLWQDNNLVVGITTAHSLHLLEDRIKRERRRPQASSKAAKITWPVFGDAVRKWLLIPLAIDDYNHGMNGVDLASQHQCGFTCHHSNCRQWWKPLFFWLLDIVNDNAYLLWKQSQAFNRHVHHQVYIDRLIDAMLQANGATLVPPPPPPPPTMAKPHHIQHLKKPQYCSMGLQKPGSCVQGQQKKRKFGSEISGNSAGRTRPRQVLTGCQECGKPLCTYTGCWERWHAYN